MPRKRRVPPGAKQLNPWESVPRAPKGDDTAEATYLAIGKALSDWEYFENMLAVLFSRFLGIASENLPALGAYGSVVAFKGRSEMVKAAAEAFFFNKPDQKLQCQVDDLLRRGNSFSARRNEIAHGVVRLIKDLEWLKRDVIGMSAKSLHWGYGVVPSEYATNKNDLSEPLGLLAALSGSAGRKPRYTYMSEQINTYGSEFIALGAEVQELSRLLLERDLRGHS